MCTSSHCFRGGSVAWYPFWSLISWDCIPLGPIVQRKSYFYEGAELGDMDPYDRVPQICLLCSSTTLARLMT
jgi:hypothetical protein